MSLNEQIMRKCSFPECRGILRAKGMCYAHYMQVKRGTPLRPLGWRPPNPVVERDDIAEIVMFNAAKAESGRAIIDRADLEAVRGHRWSMTAGYAVTHVKGRTVYMHRLLVPDGEQVDHLDGNRLNNRRGNLRPVSAAANGQNLSRPGRDALRNVHFEPRCSLRPFFAMVRVGGKSYRSKGFGTPIEAALAARELRRVHFPFANEERHTGALVFQRLVARYMCDTIFHGDPKAALAVLDSLESA